MRQPVIEPMPPDAHVVSARRWRLAAYGALALAALLTAVVAIIPWKF